MNETVGDALPAEMARIRDEVIPAYEACGPAASWFAVGEMEKDLDKSAKAMAEGDLPGMIRQLQALRAYKL